MEQDKIKLLVDLIIQYKKEETEGNWELYDLMDKVQGMIKGYEESK